MDRQVLLPIMGSRECLPILVNLYYSLLPIPANTECNLLPANQECLLPIANLYYSLLPILANMECLLPMVSLSYSLLPIPANPACRHILVIHLLLPKANQGCNPMLGLTTHKWAITQEVRHQTMFPHSRWALHLLLM